MLTQTVSIWIKTVLVSSFISIKNRDSWFGKYVFMNSSVDYLDRSRRCMAFQSLWSNSQIWWITFLSISLLAKPPKCWPSGSWQQVSQNISRHVLWIHWLNVVCHIRFWREHTGLESFRHMTVMPKYHYMNIYHCCLSGPVRNQDKVCCVVN